MIPIHLNRFILNYHILFLFLVTSCATPVPVPQNSILDESLMSEQEIAAFELQGPPLYTRGVEFTPLPEKDLRMPRANEKNSYGIVVTQELETAYLAYLGGDGEKALAALGEAEKMNRESDLFQWHVSFLKAQVLIMMGKAADAENLLDRTSDFEIAVSGGNWNSVALRGETKIWVGDFNGAKADFFRVLRAVGQWDLPTSYAMPPSNVDQLFMTTTAQLRSYTGLAALYLLQGQYEKALSWAAEAEKRYNAVHYVKNHSLYGMFVVTHLDSYYGRAVNLTFWAAAVLAHQGDVPASETAFSRAQSFFEAINYSGGEVIIEALKASSYAYLGRNEQAEGVARAAVKLAAARGMLDFVWRIETVLGKILFDTDNLQEAEAAFRRAQQSVDVVSGSLSTDQAKTRFGVGKEDITYYLSKIDRAKKDYTALFEDLERGRARSFVDMLADNIIEVEKDKDLLRTIRELDRQIVKQRLSNIAPGESKKQGILKERQLINERQKKITALRESNPELSSTMAIWTHSLSEVRQRLTAGEVIAYALPARENDNVSFLIITPENISIKELDLTPKVFRKRLKEFAARFRLETGSATSKSRGFTVGGQDEENLANVSIPAMDILQEDFKFGIKRDVEALYVVPSGDLHLMPWGVLDTDYPIIILPTGGWLNRKTAETGVRQSEVSVVVGNPEFGGDLPQLPGAEVEANSVGDMLGVDPLVGADATETALRKKIGDGAKVLHLATHGVFNHARPLESAIFLSKNEKAHPLSANDLFHNPLSAQIVVLSACETGIGKAVAGEDTLGLLRSLYLGGVTTTLSSLWPVEDEGTKEFMKLFYQHARKGEYGKGWLAARKQLKARGFSPAIYSAFVLGGLNR